MMAEGTMRPMAISGPICSTASDRRSTVSRAPVRSSEFISTRHRIHAKARSVLSMRSNPVERRSRRTVAAHQVDEQLFEASRAGSAGAQLVDGALRDQPSLGNDADVRRQALDDFEDVRRQEDRAAARDERLQQVLDLP